MSQSKIVHVVSQSIIFADDTCSHKTIMYQYQRLLVATLCAVSLCFGLVPLRPITQRGVGTKPLHQFASFPVGNSADRRKSNRPSASSSSSHEASENKLDSMLSRLTSAFPFFVLGSAILGLSKPSTLMWTNRGTLISWMLASVMCATGLTLEKKDFTKVLSTDLVSVPAGVLCQVCFKLVLIECF